MAPGLELNDGKTAEAHRPASDASQVRTLVVDLDGTLINTDLLYESFWAVIAKGGYKALPLLWSLTHGRAHFKNELATRFDLDPAELPYNQDVIELIKKRRAAGGHCALVTASDDKLAQIVANHLRLFDEVHASDGHRNLKGQAKADFLKSRFGVGAFDYVGDSRADLPVWKIAGQAVTIGLSDSLRRTVEENSRDVRHLAGPQRQWSSYVKAMRPHQWLKNLLVFLPVIAAHDLSPATWLAAVLAFISFSVVASSVYLLNDLLDLAADRAHPRKRNRPFASGAVPLAHGTVLAPGLLLLGILIALSVGRLEFFAILGVYYALTLAYSLSLKRKLVIDICTLAGLYTLRILAGGAATDISLSVWLLAFSIFLFLSLAAVKRQGELVDSAAAGRLAISGRAYKVDDLPIVSMMAIASGYVAVLVMALYLNSDAVKLLYSNAELLWIVCPVLLYWISRVVMLAHRGAMHDDPIIFAVKDRMSIVCGLIIVATVVAGSVL